MPYLTFVLCLKPHREHEDLVSQSSSRLRVLVLSLKEIFYNGKARNFTPEMLREVTSHLRRNIGPLFAKLLILHPSIPCHRERELVKDFGCLRPLKLVLGTGRRGFLSGRMGFLLNFS